MAKVKLKFPFRDSRGVVHPRGVTEKIPAGDKLPSTAQVLDEATEPESTSESEPEPDTLSGLQQAQKAKKTSAQKQADGDKI